MINFKASTIALHIIGWLFFLSLPVFFIIGQSGIYNNAVIFNNLVYCFTFIIYIVVFYLHTYILLPLFFLRKRYIPYFLSLIFFLLIVAYVKPFDTVVNRHEAPGNMVRQRGEDPPPPGFRQGPQPENMPPSPPPDQQQHGNARRSPMLDIVSIALYILVIALSTALVVTRRWRYAVEQAANAEADKAKAELSFLKAQINPHFLFNTLNNIYTMALIKDEHTPQSIMMLSNIMRYVTDDATNDFVPLLLEKDCIHNYIDLQRLRLGNKTTVNFSVEGNMADKKIAPLILMTFVENIFKYGISNSEPSVITIRLTADEKGIIFFCQNKLFPVKNLPAGTGIGIINTTKRLERLYPQKYTLDINTENGLYTVTLSLLS